MTLPVGTISMSQVNVEILQPPTQLISLNDATVRYLAGVPSGAISMSNLQGKQYRITVPYTYTSSGTTVSINVSSIAGYIAGISDVVITINGGVYFNASSTGNYGFYLYGGTTGDTITVNNYGVIYGAGGAGGLTNYAGIFQEAGNTDGVGFGGDVPNNPYGDSNPAVGGSNGGVGGPAMYASVGAPVTFNNYGSVIGGGGGAGGNGSNNSGGGSGGNGGTALVKSSNFTFLLVSSSGTFAGGGGGGSGWGNRIAGSTEGGSPGNPGVITNNGGGNFGSQGSAGTVSNYNGTTIYSGSGSWYI